MAFVASRSADGRQYSYFALQSPAGEPCLLEVATANGQCRAALRTPGGGQYNSALLDSVEQSLKGQA